MLKVGLTGGIGSGKSTIAQLFSLLKIPVYEADKRAKWLLNSDQFLVAQIKELLGDESYKNHAYNSKWIAKQVFQDSALLQKLNDIVHPMVSKDWLTWCNGFKETPYVLKEAAIMKKEGLDFIINVTAPLDVRIERVLARDSHRDRNDVLGVVSKQKSEKYFDEISDFKINNSDRNLVIPQVLSIHQQLVLSLK